MGQYYNQVIIFKDDYRINITDRRIEGQGYTMAKLTEHSWFGNNFCDTVGAMIYNKPAYIVWCGDYAEQQELDEIRILKRFNITYDEIWRSVGRDYDALKKQTFDWHNKFILNKTKKLAIDVNKYWNKSVVDVGEGESWVLNPIPILCSVGNGRGGGDYKGTGEELAGSWAGDEIMIADEPQDCEMLELFFKEWSYIERE